jgi:hypothetical protein
MLLRIGLVAVYILHVVLHALVFGKGYFRDKYWESIFAILAAVQAVVLVWSSIAHARHSNDDQACDILRISETVRPYLLISQMATLRRVFTNVLRTMYSTKEVSTNVQSLCVHYTASRCAHADDHCSIILRQMQQRLALVLCCICANQLITQSNCSVTLNDRYIMLYLQ